MAGKKFTWVSISPIITLIILTQFKTIQTAINEIYVILCCAIKLFANKLPTYLHAVPRNQFHMKLMFKMLCKFVESNACFIMNSVAIEISSDFSHANHEDFYKAFDYMSRSLLHSPLSVKRGLFVKQRWQNSSWATGRGLISFHKHTSYKSWWNTSETLLQIYISLTKPSEKSHPKYQEVLQTNPDSLCFLTHDDDGNLKLKQATQTFVLIII